ncbi:MAG: RsmF rRNA methyltransferase first C-terminal domain-containing protein [Lachnospiraceae bacterium]|nr:RsmF rRNA methyltransferase first C-terminal domain-containing protein [Lachnospiraceae bacterium]
MLPELFLKRMKEMLGAEYDDFLASFDRERYQALRLNPLKITAGGERADKVLIKSGDVAADSKATSGKFCVSREKQVPWSEYGYYYDKEEQPGKHPYHDAGVYYIQEPSAQAPVPHLEVKPGERVLDLCAAPGGKTTQIAAAMRGQGFLLANEIHPARAKILSENIERMGVVNACVTNETPARLADNFPEYFDKILVDAPCSGEGMFRKNEDACDEWSPENVTLCAERQDEILDCAARMLRPGGRIVYSTCTFAREEDEGSVERFLERHAEFTVRETLRLWPHKVKGEGHFAAVLEKSGEVSSEYRPIPMNGLEKGITEKALEKDCKEFKEFVSETFGGGDWKEKLSSGYGIGEDVGSQRDCDEPQYLRFGEQLYLIPSQMPALKGLKVLRPGLHLGTIKKNRFEPSHALALALAPSEVAHVWNLDSEGAEVRAYLNGQTFSAEGEKGWYLVCVDGFGLGWGKLAGGTMKNHYPKGLRK